MGIKGLNSMLMDINSKVGKQRSPISVNTIVNFNTSNKTNVKKNNNKFIQHKYLTNYKNKTIAIDLSNYLYKAIYNNEKNFIYYIFKIVTKLKRNNIVPIFVFDGKSPEEKTDTIKQRRDKKDKAIDEEKKLIKFKKHIQRQLSTIFTSPELLDNQDNELNNSNNTINNNCIQNVDGIQDVDGIQTVHSIQNVDIDGTIDYTYDTLYNEDGEDIDILYKFDLNDLKNIDLSTLSKQECDTIINRIDDKLLNIKKKTCAIKQHHTNTVKQLFDILKVKYIYANSEADIICAYLVNKNYAFACISDDMDLFAYGCKRILRGFNIYNNCLYEYKMSKLLSAMNISQSQFIDMCICSGTDYNNKIVNTKITDNYELIREYGCIENIVDNIKTIQKTQEHTMSRIFHLPNKFNYEKSRQLFDIPNFTSEYINSLINNIHSKFNHKSIDKLKKFLIENIDSKSIINTIMIQAVDVLLPVQTEQTLEVKKNTSINDRIYNLSELLKNTIEANKYYNYDYDSGHNSSGESENIMFDNYTSVVKNSFGDNGITKDNDSYRDNCKTRDNDNSVDNYNTIDNDSTRYNDSTRDNYSVINNLDIVSNNIYRELGYFKNVREKNKNSKTVKKDTKLYTNSNYYTINIFNYLSLD